MDSFVAPDTAIAARNRSFEAMEGYESVLPTSPGLTFLQQYAVREMNAILWALLIAVTSMLLKRLLQLVCLWSKGSRLPGPPSPGFAGHASSIAAAGGPDNFTGFLRKLHEEYGAVVRLWLGPTHLLVSVKDRDMIQELLVHAMDRVPSTGKALQLAFGRGSLFTASFNQAQRQRFLFSEVFNGQLVHRVHSICRAVIRELENCDKGVTASLELDCMSVSQHISFRVLGTSVFGDSFLTWPAADEFENLLLLISKEACFWSAYSILPFWNKKFQRYKKNCLRLQKLMKEIVRKSRKQNGCLLDHGHGNTKCTKSCLNTLKAGVAAKYGSNVDLSGDAISGLVTAHSLCGPFELNKDFCENLTGMMFHGALTTAGIISGTLTRLAQYPLIQRKVWAEIDDICDCTSGPTADDIQKMHFLKATLHESARLLPSGPLLQRCSLSQDLKLSPNVTVPVRAILAVPVQLVQMDTCRWGSDAEIFKPERFLCQKQSGTQISSWTNKISLPEERSTMAESKGSSAETVGELKERIGLSDPEWSVDALIYDKGTVFKDPYNDPFFLLFGAGSRSCIGRNFAIVEMITVLATLLQHYEIKLCPGAGKDLNPKFENCILQLSPGPKLIFKPRHQH